MKISSISVPRVIVIVIMVAIACAAFYGLANGTILQHRSEGVSGSAECNGLCSECTGDSGSIANGTTNDAANSTGDRVNGATVIQMNQPNCAECGSDTSSCYYVK
jgi:hypothetical protein